MKHGGEETTKCSGKLDDVHFSVVKTWRGYAAHRFWNVNFLLDKGRSDREVTGPSQAASHTKLQKQICKNSWCKVMEKQEWVVRNH
jgi:hypothetical protein